MIHPVMAAMTQRRSAKAAAMTGEINDRSIIEAIITAGAAAPDHGLLVPFRFVEIAPGRRAALADAFEAALRTAQPDASAEDASRARDKALHGPLLLALIGRFQPQHPKITLTDQWLAAGGALQKHGAGRRKFWTWRCAALGPCIDIVRDAAGFPPR